MAAIRHTSGEVRRFLTSAAVFTAIGLLLYGALYVWSERLVWRHAQANKFFLVKSAPPMRYDYVVLGASHAAALDYQDMTARLEALTQRKIVNLALVGGGVRVSRLIFDYFLTRHQTDGLVYVVDSFAFYARTWNEERLRDTRLFVRAPFDVSLGRVLLLDGATRSIGVDFVTGFSKINNKDRFAADVTPEESTRFNRAYRPVKQIDDQRLEYLYPREIDQAAFAHYMTEFEKFLRDVQSRGIRVLVVKPPIPDRIVNRIPGESEFDARLKELLAGLHIPLHDFTRTSNGEKFFYDTDHLNKDGVLDFFQTSLAPLLAQ
jgi:hypothetical protein